MINVGVIGCGYWGPNLIRNFNELKEVKVSGVADLSESRLRFIKSKFSFNIITKDYRDILHDPSIDAAVIATHVSTHYAIAKDALKANKHVFIEKPITDSSLKAEELIKLAKRNKKIIFVGHTFEYHPAIIKIKKIMRGKEIGNVYYIDSCRVNLGLHQSDVSVLWDLGPHDVSIILGLLGKTPQRVSAIGKSYVQKGIEDVVFLVMEFNKHLLAHIHISWLAPSKLRRMVIVSDKKMIVYDDTESVEKIKIFDRRVKFLTSEDYRKALPTYRIGSIVSPNIEPTEPLHIECQHFVDCIKKGKVPLTDGYFGLNVVRVLEAAQESLRNNGQNVTVEKG